MLAQIHVSTNDNSCVFLLIGRVIEWKFIFYNKWKNKILSRDFVTWTLNLLFDNSWFFDIILLMLYKFST